MRVGLTGGIGSGKSAVARLFSGWGAVIVDADILAREVSAPGTLAFAEIGERWPTVINAQGSLDRAALARIIFADAAAREELGLIIHPRVRQRASEFEATAAPKAVVVHVVPLLFESDYWKSCARTVLVRAPRHLRISRVVARDGTTAAAVEARMAAQIDPVRAAALADDIIENDADPILLETRARPVYDMLEREAAR